MGLGLYEGIAEASGRMLEAARAEDWEGLLEAEADCAALIERARACSCAERFSPQERSRKNQILRRVLADDAEIRARLQPWLAKLERLLGAAERGRRMQHRYGG